MAIIKRDGSKYWYIQFQYGGKMYIKSAKTTDKELAERLESNWRKQLIEQYQLGIKPTIETLQAFKEYSASKKKIVSHYVVNLWAMRAAEFFSMSPTSTSYKVVTLNGSRWTWNTSRTAIKPSNTP